MQRQHSSIVEAVAISAIVGNLFSGHLISDLVGDDDLTAHFEDADYEWDRESALEAWDAMDDLERAEILDTYDELYAEGRLGDVPFRDQWLAARA